MLSEQIDSLRKELMSEMGEKASPPAPETVTREEFNELKGRIEELYALIKTALGGQGHPSDSIRQPSMADRVAASERIRQQGMAAVKGRDGTVYGVKPEVLEAKTERRKGGPHPALLHASGFYGLRQEEVKGLLDSYGLNTKDIIVMSFMGETLELVVGGGARDRFREVLSHKGKLLENVDVLDGSPLKLNVSTGMLTDAELSELRREAAKQAREARWNRIIAKIPKEQTRKRALLARVRDGRLAELRNPMRESPTQQSRGMTRLDLLVMAKLEAAVAAASSGDESMERPRKILNRQVASIPDVTRAQ